MTEDAFKKQPCCSITLPREVAEAINASYQPGEDVIVGYATRIPGDPDARQLVCWSVPRPKLVEVMKEAGLVYKRKPRKKPLKSSGLTSRQ